jgi:hypothetical protein
MLVRGSKTIDGRLSFIQCVACQASLLLGGSCEHLRFSADGVWSLVDGTLNLSPHLYFTDGRFCRPALDRRPALYL